ncbi:hypothetical protein [Haloplanus salilacus]|uniref:hypothetical protein n=1 Tax=Haloplanus salilacus TaxID=2949994 RepID=UPI0030D4D0A2
MSEREPVRPDGGAPEPGGPLTDRQRTRLKLFVALVVVGLLTVRVGALLDRAWDARGIGHAVAFALTAPRFDIDFAVLFPFGLVTGWLGLFVVDRTKTHQRWPAILAYSLLIAWLVFVENRWREEVKWVAFWYVAAVGGVAGLTTGLAPKLFGNRRREFPAAAVGLFLAATTLCTVAFLDVYLVAADRVPAVGGPVGPAIDAVSVAGFVVLFGWFVLYSDYRSVAVLGTSRLRCIGVMAGLLNHVQDDEYDGESKVGGPALLDMKQSLREHNNVDGFGADHGPQYFEFVYLPSTHPSRLTYVSAVPIDIGDVGEATIKRIVGRAADADVNRATDALRRGLRRGLSFVADNVLPGSLKRRLSTETGLLVDNIAGAGTLVFVTSIEDFEGYGPDATLADLSPPAELEKFTKLCTKLGGSRDRVIVVTDAHEVLDLDGRSAVTDDGFAGFVRGQLLDVGREYTVVPVTWDGDHAGDGLVAGVSALRRALDA